MLFSDLVRVHVAVARTEEVPMTVEDEARVHSREAREPVGVFPVHRERTDDATLRLDHGKGTVPPIATSACLDEALGARLVARLEHRLELVETSGALPTGSRRAWRAELAVVACLDEADPSASILCEAACDAVAHRLWSRPNCWSGADDGSAVRDLHTHVASEIERVRARKQLPDAHPLWAAALTIGGRLWLLGEGEAIVYLQTANGALRTTELRDGILSTRLDVTETHGLALALGEACGRLEDSLVANRLASEDRLDVVVADLAERARVAGGRRGAWIVARFVDAT
jgi:hypothetical protein